MYSARVLELKELKMGRHDMWTVWSVAAASAAALPTSERPVATTPRLLAEAPASNETPDLVPGLADPIRSKSLSFRLLHEKMRVAHR